MSTVVIIGGGAAGAAAARALETKVGGKHDLVLIEQEPEVFFQPGLLWYLTDHRNFQDFTKRIADMASSGIEIIWGKAVKVDPARHGIHLRDGTTIDYDYLILACGADISTQVSPELDIAGYSLYSLDGISALKDTLEEFVRGDLVLLVTGLPVKCPPAVYEAAFLLQELVQKKGRKGIRLSIYTPEPFPFQAAGPKVGRAIKKKLEARGIALYTRQNAESVDTGNRVIHFKTTRVPFDLLAYVPRHMAPPIARNSHLADETGWIPVDPFTLQTRQPNIYAIGDVTRIPMPSSGLDLPKSGASAHFQAWVVADNLVSKLSHRPPSRYFGGKSPCIVELGVTGFGFYGDYYAKDPRFRVFPESRLWIKGKHMVERLWLNEHS